MRVLAVERVGGEHRTARLRDVAGDAGAELDSQGLHLLLLGDAVALDGDRHDVVPLHEVDAAAVVVDEPAQLAHDRLGRCPSRCSGG